jgi:hypothetical protein
MYCEILIGQCIETPNNLDPCAKVAPMVLISFYRPPQLQLPWFNNIRAALHLEAGPIWWYEFFNK